jgi:HD superfamily phosphohydrolase
MSRPLWHGLPVSLAHLQAEVQKVFEIPLLDYLEHLRVRGLPQEPKVINDPIWHTIRVESWELPILDSPLIQRLRNIRQLGLASLVYPAAGYSRFEHTIGALYQTQRVIESINRNARARGARVQRAVHDPIPYSDEVMLRIAAIMHDAGHCFLSHVSERAIHQLELDDGQTTMEAALRDAKEFFGSQKGPSVGELLSALIALLPEFTEVLTLANVPSWQGRTDRLVWDVAKLIVRGRFSDRPFMNEIISGALDVDKLDYMSRDSYMAGLAVPIDVERLLEKMCTVTVPASKLPEYAKSSGVVSNQAIQVLAVQRGGARAFEDLVVSRVLLYDKLYNHQKVRAAEGAVVNALELLQKDNPEFRKVSTYIRLSESQFFEQEWPPPATSTPGIEVAKKIVAGIRLRTIFVRAFAFGPELISESDGVTLKWRKLKRLVAPRSSAHAKAFRTRVTEKAQLYLKTYGQTADAEKLKDAHLVVDLPDVQGIAEKTKFFVGDEDTDVEFYNQMFRVEKWSEAYESQKLIGYVFCPIEHRVAVHLAFRDIVKEECKLSFDKWSWQLAKIPPQELADFSAELGRRGIDTEPAPVPEALSERRVYLNTRAPKIDLLAPYDSILEELGEKFRSYQSGTSEDVTKGRIVDWLLQFNSEDIPSALGILEHVRFWDRAAMMDAFSMGLDHLGIEALDAQWVPLGGGTTSSRLLSYLMPDLNRLAKCPKAVLGSANDLQDAERVIFYDENVYSATQSRTVFKQWLGRPQKEWLVDEKHVVQLPDAKLAILRKARIDFLFLVGRRDGLRALTETVKELLGNRNVDGHIVAPDETSCFREAACVFDNRDSIEKARKAFERAGRNALADKKGIWEDAKIEDRLLGYGNPGGLNVFFYNVPTSTVTALWRTCQQSSWMALFPRRRRE